MSHNQIKDKDIRDVLLLEKAERAYWDARTGKSNMCLKIAKAFGKTKVKFNKQTQTWRVMSPVWDIIGVEKLD